MILKSYLFAQTAGVYQQFVSESHTESYLRSVCKQCKTDNQIAIHRDGNLMYYAYVHRISLAEAYGLCVVCGEVCLNIQEVFDYFQKVIEYQAQKGVLFRYDEKGIIRKNVASFASEPAEIDSMFRDMKQYLENRPSLWEKLPAEDLSVPMTSSITLSLADDDKKKILEAIRHYHNVIITLENSVPSSFSRTVARLQSENSDLQSTVLTLKNDVSTLRTKQKNMLWVSLLSIVVVVLFLILYFKVINPSEVSKYQTSEFLYYGPIKDKEPNGEGVAFYPSDDPDGRRYYIGNFDNGERNDTEAMLYYQSGDYFYGTMVGDQWDEGIFYSNSTGSHFVGTFVNNEPSDGTWYRHEEAYRVRNGKPVRY